MALLACAILQLHLLLLLLPGTAGAHNLPKLSELLASTGLDAGQEQEFSDKQRALIEEIMDFYERDDNLHDEERAVLAHIGSSLPDANQKAHLQRMFLSHFENWRKLNQMARELTKENNRLARVEMNHEAEE